MEESQYTLRFSEAGTDDDSTESSWDWQAFEEELEAEELKRSPSMPTEEELEELKAQLWKYREEDFSTYLIVPGGPILMFVSMWIVTGSFWRGLYAGVSLVFLWLILMVIFDLLDGR